MKRQDWMVIAGVGLLTAVLSFVVSGALFGSPKKNPIKVPVVNKITSDFPQPATDENYRTIFNPQAFNPTQLIKIGGSGNTTPFQNPSP